MAPTQINRLNISGMAGLCEDCDEPVCATEAACFLNTRRTISCDKRPRTQGADRTGTNSTVQRHYAASHNVSRLLRNRKFHNRVHKTSLL
jgi:hypothetical protein